MRFKRNTFITLIIITGLVLGTNATMAAELGTILVDDLNIRSGPGQTFRTIGRLAQGIRVRILAREKEWLKIEHNGTTGYISASARFVKISAAATPDKASESNELKNLRRDAETIQERLKTSQTELAAMNRKEQGVINAFNATEEALNKTRRQVHAAEAALEELRSKIGQIEASYAKLEREIRNGEAYAAQRLTALYKLNWVGRVHLLATADSFFDFINRKSALERILAQDETLLEKLHADQTALASLLAQLNARKSEKRAVELALKKRIATLSAEQNKRGALLAKIRSEKNLELAALKALKAAAKELDATLQSLKPAVVKPQEKETAKPFDAYKGLLSWPVRGKIISFFGPFRDEKYDVMNFQSGINIQAERGEPIRAVSDGFTIFSNWFKGFGNMLIIDHGDHYYTVYAHLEEVFKVKGDRVEKGEVIATVGDSGSLMGPALHFEVRHHGKPIDPLQWIKKG